MSKIFFEILLTIGMLVLFSSHQQQVARYLGNFLQAFQSFHPPSHCINKPFPFYFTQISSWLWSVLGNPLILLKVHSTKIISKWDKKKKSVIKIRLVSAWTLKRITEKLGLCRVFANQFSKLWVFMRILYFEKHEKCKNGDSQSQISLLYSGEVLLNGRAAGQGH